MRKERKKLIEIIRYLVIIVHFLGVKIQASIFRDPREWVGFSGLSRDTEPSIGGSLEFTFHSIQSENAT